MNIIKVVCTIIGTFIGAGFASGKEVYLFFYKYGMYGITGIIISCIIFGYVIYKVICISKKNYIQNYNEFIDYIIKNKFIKKLLLNFIDIFLIISFCVMVSGFSAFIKQEFNINVIIGYIIILLCSCLVFRKKAGGIVKINNILIPIIVFVILFIMIKKINILNLFPINNLKSDKYNFNFLIYSILYANYNLLSIIPIIITMANIIKRKKDIKYISIISTIIIFILTISIFVILYEGKIDVSGFEMPIVYIVGKFGNLYKYLYCFIIGISIFTTAISVGYGYLQNYENDKNKYNKKIILLIISAIIAMPIGFSKLIELLYPVFGFIGLIQTFYIIKS